MHDTPRRIPYSNIKKVYKLTHMKSHLDDIVSQSVTLPCVPPPPCPPSLPLLQSEVVISQCIFVRLKKTHDTISHLTRERESAR